MAAYRLRPQRAMDRPLLIPDGSQPGVGGMRKQIQDVSGPERYLAVLRGIGVVRVGRVARGFIAVRMLYAFNAP